MRIRLKSLDLNRIWYLPVEEELEPTPEALRVRVAKTLKRQYRRLEGLDMWLLKDSEVLAYARKRRRPRFHFFLSRRVAN